MNQLEFLTILNQKKRSGFTTEWTVSGGDLTITLPLTNNGSYLCRVDWGDGESSVITAYNSNNSHTYAGAGSYNVEIVGSCPGWSFNNSGDKAKCTDIITWGHKNMFIGFQYLVGAFYGSAIRSLGTDKILVSSDSPFTTLENAFRDTEITAIPEGIFDYCVALTADAFKATFKDCEALETIASGIFDNCVDVSTAAFYETFNTCTSLIEIPTGLFNFNVDVADYAFYKTFDACSTITEIPTDLFINNSLVGDHGFEMTFARCINLAGIPDGLFDNNLVVGTQGFKQTFMNDNRLAYVPEFLFKYNTSVTTEGFYGTFYGCIKAQFNQYIFYANGEETTRFENIDSDFTECFYRETFTGTQGTAPNLWQCEFGSGNLVKDLCFGGAGNDVSSLDNYGDIPGDWITI